MKASEAMTAGALEHPSWIQWGGPRFVLATIGFGGWLYLLPPWVSAVAATLLVASLWSPIEATHVKIAAFTYVLFFMKTDCGAAAGSAALMTNSGPNISRRRIRVAVTIKTPARSTRANWPHQSGTFARTSNIHGDRQLKIDRTG